MKTLAWHRTVGAWLGPISLPFALYWATPLWLISSIVVYLVLTISFTSGYHRLFAHGAYTCHRIWHWVFGLLGCVGLNSSPTQWVIVHVDHHKYSDTDRDPHDVDWKYFTRIHGRTNLPAGRRAMRMMRDPMHRFLIRHSFTVSLSWALLTLVLGGPLGLLYLYLLPVGMLLFSTGLVTIYAHKEGNSIDRPWLEFVIPLCGEWLHREHHNRPRITPYPGGMDLGGRFIELIRTDGIRSTNRTAS
jgi:stearoyl-CoA desaturase (delta-9 desaturase)